MAVLTIALAQLHKSTWVQPNFQSNFEPLGTSKIQVIRTHQAVKNWKMPPKCQDFPPSELFAKNDGSWTGRWTISQHTTHHHRIANDLVLIQLHSTKHPTSLIAPRKIKKPAPIWISPYRRTAPFPITQRNFNLPLVSLARSVFRRSHPRLPKQRNLPFVSPSFWTMSKCHQ